MNTPRSNSQNRRWLANYPEQVELALQHLPNQPGIYQMYNEKNVILYVGKAKNLKNRVRSYFQNPDGLLPKVRRLMEQVHHFETIVTDSEVEALILEFNLIKKHQPKYNILLRDDKRFPWIGLSAEPFPRLFITRQPTRKGRFFGPYVNSNSLYKTLDVIRKHFQLRQRKRPLFQSRPCMNYFIGNCLAPCQNWITEEAYQQVVRQVELFLKGHADELLKQLEQDMLTASDALQFERAAKIRDRYRAVQDVLTQQKMIYPDDTMNQDCVVVVAGNSQCIFTVLNIRKGRLIASKPTQSLLSDPDSLPELYAAFLMTYYDSLPPEEIPSEILVQFALPDSELLAQWLGERRQKKVTLTLPQRGLKKDMLALALKNARQTLEQLESTDIKQYQGNPTSALIELQDSLRLPEFPARMECYDISHFQGKQTVASMVVFINGVPDKQQYRRFKIHSAEGEPDDFKSMEEVITRRFQHVLQQDKGWEEPDLVIIDGGKGQLSSACKALGLLGLTQQPIISLAKKFEEVFLPGESRPVILPRSSPALFVLQQIRDESHRFAITYHRQLRQKKATHSFLDTIAGIGEKRKQGLLQHYGTVDKIKQATLEELSAVKGMTRAVAQTVYQAFHP
jgi:excinuclease ABC subunit C